MSELKITQVRGVVGARWKQRESLRTLGLRVETLSTAVVDELEGPLVSSVALMRGLRTGAGRLVELLVARVKRSRTPRNGVDRDE